MASNKKAQILAAVMCASSIFGSYTVVSAADTPTKIESTDKNSSVTANGSTITATAGAQGSQQSTITLGNKSLAINVGKQTTTDGITYGAFTLNSSNLAVNNSGLSVKNTKGIVVGSISNTGAITGTGLTIKNGTGTTLASLNNNGLNIYDGINTKATATITKAGAITGTGLTVKAVSDTIKPEGDYVESKVTTSGVADTIKQGGFTRATSNVTTNSIKDTIYTDSGIELSSINVFKNTAANGIENGKVSLTAKKIVTDNQTSTTTTSTLTLGGDNASLKVGNYGFTVDSNNNVLFSGKNASLTSTGLTVNGTGTSSIKSTNTNENSSTVGSYTKNDISYNGMTTTAKGGKYPSDSDNDNKTTSSVTYTGVRDTVYDDSGNIKSTSVVDTNGVTLTSNRYDTGSKISSSLTIKGDSATLTSGTAYVKVDNTVGNVTLSGKNASLTSTGLTVNGTGTSSIKSTNATTEAYTKNDISYAGMTTTVRGGKNPSESDNVNKTTSAVTYTGVTDTVYDDGGNLKTKSSVTTSGISNTTSLKTTTGKIDTAINQNTSGVGITSTKYNTNDDVTDKTSLTMNGSANSITSIKYNDSNKTAETTSVSVNGATSSITSYGNYVYDDESGKATSYNQASMSLNGNTGTATIRGGSNTASSTLTLNEAGVALSGKNASLSGSTFTLKDTTNGKTLASLGASGLSLNKVNSDETTTNYGTWNSNGLTVNGTGYTTIKSTNATTGAMGQSQVSYNGVTDTVTNGTNTTTSTVGATGVTDTVTNASNQTLAQSQVNTAGITLTANKYDEENTKTSSSLSIKGDSATLTSGTAYVKVDNTLGNVTLSGNNATLSGSTFTLKDATNGKTLASLGASGLSINNADGIKVGGISNTGNLIANDGMNVTDKNSSWVNIGTSTMQKDIAATTTTSYAGITNKIDTTLAGNKTYTSGTVVGPTSVTTTVQGSNTTDAISGNKNKTTSTVSATGVTDTVYNVKGNQVASSSVTTNGIVNTTTNLSIDGSTNNTMSTSIYQDKRGISASATKKDENGTVGTSTLTLAGNSASLKVGNYGFAVDSNNNVSIAGNNATLSGSTFTLKDANGKTATLNTSGLTLKDEDGNTTGGISTTGAVTGTSLNITAKNTDGNKTTSTVGATGVTDAVYGTDGARVAYSNVGTGGISNTTSLKTTTGKIDTAINQNTSGVGISSTKYDTNNNVTDKTSLTMNGSANNITSTKYNDSNKTTETTSVSVNGATSSITSYGNYVYGEDGKATSYNQASMSLNGNTGTATIRGGSNTASSTLTLNEAGVALSGKNASLSGSTFTLKDTTNGKTLASLGASGLSINNADGIKVGGISNTGNLIANDGMNVTDKNSSWVNIGTSTMQKDIAATTTTSYAGITNKIDTTLAGNKTYTSGTVVGPTSVTTTVQGSNTTDAISGNKNKTTSTVSATGVTDTVYNVKGNQVASSSVTTNGIVNTTTNLSIDGSTNNTMSTSIYQDKRGISASATKKDENGTVGTSTLTLAGNSASLKVGNYGFAVDSNNNVSIAGNNATLSGSTFTLKDANGKTATLNTSGLTLKDEDGNTTGGISSTGAITGTSLRITTSEDTNGNKTVSTVATNGVTDTVTNNKTNNKTTSQVSANGVTDTVYGTDGTTKVASSSVSTSGISNTTSLKTTTGKIDTAINQNTSGVGISSTKYDTNNNVTDKTSVSVNGGTSSITSYGSYIYGEDGKATSYNQASISLNGNTGTATIRGGSNTASSTLTLNEAGVALSGKNVGLNANGLTLYKDVDGVKTQYASLSAGGLDVKGTGSTTIKSTNATTGAIGQSQVSYNGVTDSFTKDDVTNSVTTNANGTIFSSTGNGSTTIKGDTIKTTNLIVNGKDIGGVATDVAGIDRNTENEDGLGYYTQIEGKTKIYNTGRFSTANGNFVVDPYGSITSKAGNYRFNMDRTSGFDLGYAATTSFTLDNTGVSLGFRNNSFILDKNGATFINANGENVSFTSINGGTITTGETVINGSSITTKDLYVDNIHLNGAITDGNGNVVGGGDLSLGADGTLDLKYNANGITNTFVSGATGVHSSFSNGTTTASSSVGYIDDKNTIGIKDQVGNTSVTTTTDGTTFANGSGSTTINGGNITTTGDVTVGGDLSVGDNFKVDGTTGNVTGGTYNGVQISTDKDGNAIIGGTNIGDLATNEEVNKVNDKVDAVDNKVGDTSKLDKEITDNQNYKDNQNLVGAVNAEADIRRNEISRIDGQIEQLDGRVGSLENRMSDVEDRIDKVGAMSAAIANLRTMGFDPEAPTEIAIGVGQYKSETGLALGVFHYPNQDFMLSASISTSGDEVMGGIGATWKLGRKSAAEKAKDEEARRLEKAEEMKKLAQDAKVKAQAERHAKLLAEREAQKTA